MYEVLDEWYPKARKEYTCMYCGEKIKKGELYERSRCKYEDRLYDWICHIDCGHIIGRLPGFNWALENDVVDDEEFVETIDEYVHTHHYNKKTGDIETEWKVPVHQQVKMILKELKENKNGK